jgi:hypothetical protein
MFYTKTTNTMSMTIEMVVARVEALEKQFAFLLQQTKTDADSTKTKASKNSSDVSVDGSKKKTKKEVSSDDEVEVVKAKKEPKKAKKEVASDDDDKPKKKRGPSGYILFSNANRDDVKEQLCVGDDKPKNTDIMKQLAHMWGELADDEKAVWNAKAKEVKDAKETVEE